MAFEAAVSGATVKLDKHFAAVLGVMVELAAYWAVDRRCVELTAELRTALVELLHWQSLRLIQQQYQVFLQLHMCIQH